MNWWCLSQFVFFAFGYWIGRDKKAQPVGRGEAAPLILYGWALVGILNFFAMDAFLK